jgi:PEGA domain
MTRRLRFFGTALTLAFVAIAVTGCVDRRFVVESDPPGAVVTLNGKYIGAAPAYQSFTYYGKYRFVFTADGYETLTVDEQIRTPWWSYFPLEFAVENLWPFTIRDVRIIHHSLVPRQYITPQAILERAQQLQAEGLAISPVCPPAIVIPAPVPAPPLAPGSPVMPGAPPPPPN